MKVKIDEKLIRRFRETVNGNLSFVYEQYHNRDGKNHWHVICSSMDWISVAVRFLRKVPKFSTDIDIKVMQVFSIISAIDLVYEAVAQLNRVFKSAAKPPFHGEDTIFGREHFDQDDNEYFKEIRSCFGAHPVNLKKDNSNSRRYASWPFEPFADNASLLEVRLYDGRVGVSDVHFGLPTERLLLFLQSRYDYLNELIDEIERQFSAHSRVLAGTEIPKSASVIDELKLLKSESIKRFNNDYYNSTIDELMRIFAATCQEDLLQAEETSFKERLMPLVAEIRTNLQTAQLDDLEGDRVLNPEWYMSSVHYELSKFLIWLNGRTDDALVDYYFERLNDFSRNHYRLSAHESLDTTFLKTKLLMQRLNEFG